MFPLYDDVPSRHTPIVTRLLIALNVLVFLTELTLSEPALHQTFQLMGVVPLRYADPAWATDVGFPSTLGLPFLTSQFLHAGWVHLIGNVWTLWVFGDNVEDRLGRVGFLVFYLGAGFAAGFLHVATSLHSTVPTIGASGAIAGVLGAYLLFHPKATVVAVVPIVIYPLVLELPAAVFLVTWFAIQFASGSMALGEAGDAGGVAWWAHVGGFVAGLVLMPLLALGAPPPGSDWREEAEKLFGPVEKD